MNFLKELSNAALVDYYGGSRERLYAAERYLSKVLLEGLGGSYQKEAEDDFEKLKVQCLEINAEILNRMT